MTSAAKSQYSVLVNSADGAAPTAAAGAQHQPPNPAPRPPWFAWPLLVAAVSPMPYARCFLPPLRQRCARGRLALHFTRKTVPACTRRDYMAALR